MLKSRIFGIEIAADFTFFAAAAMFIALDTSGLAVMSLAVCMIHEAGHFLAMLMTGQKPQSLLFRGGGIKIAASRTTAFTLIAGSLLNIVLFFALYFTLPKTDIYPVMFAVLNLATGLFNLLPIGCLDGKQLLDLVLTRTLPQKHSERIGKAVQTVAIAAVTVAVIAAISKGGVNFTLVAVLIYIICVDFFQRI